MSSLRRVPKRVHAAYEHALEVLSVRPDVVGIDVGPKYVDGESTGEFAVRVHVQKKRAVRSVVATERIPESLGGVQTDVIEAKYRRHGGSVPRPWARHDTLRPGISVGNPKAEAGTLGLIVYDNATGAPCVLSAFHVLAGPFAEVGDPVTQPARIDQGHAPHDTIATLLRYFLPGSWGDAAVARLNTKRAFDPAQLGSGARIASLGIPTIGQIVEKAGRTTEVTRGRVEGIGTYFYPEVSSGVNGFRIVPEHDNPDVQDLSAVGDSGSIYYTPSGAVGVGLHCAGEVGDRGAELAIACFLTRVMTTLGVSLSPPQ